MPYISWDDSMSVGVKQFDADHQKLISYINKLHTALLAGDGAAVMGDLLNALFDYTVIHFAAEEKSMDVYGYPGLPQQKAQHEDLIRRLREFNEQYRSGKTSFSLTLMSFLKDWLINHINGSDRMYKDFFISKGVK
jgi:hemerythrin